MRTPSYTEPMDRPTSPSDGHEPRLLALDTATERMAVAVVDGARHWGAEEAGGAQTSQRLLPVVFGLLERAGLTLADLDAVAFGRGPGALTGLRTACSVAQGLAFGAGLQVLPIDSLALIAEDAWARYGDAARQVWVAMDARMDEAYAAAYRRGDGQWVATHEPALWTVAALAAAWQRDPPTCVAGSALEAFADRLPSGPALRLGVPHDRAAALANLARQAWLQGQAVDAALALPLYLRDKVALTTAEREAAAAAKAARVTVQ